MLFYYLLKCSPLITDQLIEKYAENPYNSLMVVEYDQN